MYKGLLVSGVRKSFPKLAFAFGNLNLLGLVDLDFFITIDRFLILLPILLSALPPTALPASADIALFLLSSIAWVLKASLFVVWSIEVSDVAILLKFLMKLL